MSSEPSHRTLRTEKSMCHMPHRPTILLPKACKSSGTETQRGMHRNHTKDYAVGPPEVRRRHRTESLLASCTRIQRLVSSTARWPSWNVSFDIRRKRCHMGRERPVSQMVSFTFFPLSSTALTLKSTPVKNLFKLALLHTQHATHVPTVLVLSWSKTS